jgi:heterodisulfide reductase subunit A-like polyferredoxin
MVIEDTQLSELKEAPRKVGSVMVVGAGIAGMQAALDLAGSGFKVYLVEKKSSIGGVMAQLDKTFPTNDCSTCMISPKLIEVAANPNIEIITGATVDSLDGEPGNFMANVALEPRFVDKAKCTSCGECTKVCPVEVPADFNESLNMRKAIYKHFPQAIPSTFAIDKRGTSPCKATCPAHISIQGYIALIAQGKYKEAIKLIKQEHPFPATCGRICHHPCEQACTRARVDDPVAIEYLKRFVADLDLKDETRYVPEAAEKRDDKVAVIGAGPAGLTAAYYLAWKGYPVTVFEKLHVTGGMMAVGIPAYRMPREVLAAEIQVIRDMGVEIKTGVTFGEDITLESLKKDGCAAVFLATGLHASRKLNVPGEDIQGVLKGVDFLRETALDKPVKVNARVLVIGGGNVAIDVAHTALRKGAEEVSLVCLEQRAEMPAWDYEIKEALEEGIKIENGWGPIKFLEKDGRVAGVLFKSCTRVFDENGRFNPQYDESETTTREADTVIVAIGQAADLFFAPAQGIEIKGGGLAADPVTLETSIPGVFAGGDVFYGPRSVVEAVESGKEAAESIYRYLNGLDLRENRKKDWSHLDLQPEGEPHIKRTPMRSLSLSERKATFKEIALGFNEEEAKAEAARCIECGICSECYQCVAVCQAGAIDHHMSKSTRRLNIGAVVLAPGYRPFDASLKPELGYGLYPNVITSLEFERVLSAAGPFGGHIQRPSDAREPVKVAWIQCVGSRDASIGQDYCSSVCCMYATKQAIIAREHDHRIQPAIFYMDIRAHGKGFDRYYERAMADHGVRYVRSMVSRVTENPVTHDLEMHYLDEQGVFQDEIFDLVILSVGLKSNPDAQELARKTDLDLDRFGFAQHKPFDLVSTSRTGVYACGVFQSPKDIPETVVQASSASADAQALLSDVRGSMVRELEFPEEREVLGEEPRIGVFVCHCGINIAGVVDVKALSEYGRSLPHVVYATDNLFTCSTDAQDKMQDIIREHNLNRVVVASCSPRTHESLFQDNMRKAGLNKYLFEMANIRDQCSWVHQQSSVEATEKAKDLVRMSAARAALLEPLYEIPFDVTQKGLVVGGGVAGMTAALSLADQGFETTLVELTDTLGGQANKLYFTGQGENVRAYVTDLIDRVQNHNNIHVLTSASVEESKGHIGKFSTRINVNGQSQVVEHGIAIIATGGSEYEPTEYLYGEHPQVLSQRQLHELLGTEAKQIGLFKNVVMIQCVGSRNEEHPYCSRVCCTQAVVNALKVKELNPRAQIFMLYRDVRTFGLNELYYKRAREEGVCFVRFDPGQEPVVSSVHGELMVSVFDQNMRTELKIPADAVVLSAAIRPRPESKPLATTLKLPLDADGFFLEAHVKLRPLDFASPGYFLCGLAHSPKSLEESIAQAKGAASRAATVLAQKQMLVGGQVAVVDREKCVVCLTCARTCPFGVPKVAEDGFIDIDPAECQGCGNCASACPRKLIQVQHMRDDQIIAEGVAINSIDGIMDVLHQEWA